ncbi:MAG: PhzF family phenazine biosynthesis protein [Pseudomonadota bacterium]
MTRPYTVVDVFSAEPLLGNPVAVVLEAEGLSEAQMGAFARWTNLSETTFVLPPTRDGADYWLRIFTPGGELPFAGHPTLGSAHAVLEAGRAAARDGVLVQECGVGLVQVAVGGSESATAKAGRMTLTLPTPKVRAFADGDVAEIEGLLGHGVMRTAPPAAVDVGIVWGVAQVASVEVLLALEPDMVRSAAFERRLELTGLSVFAVSNDPGVIEVRSFTGSCGIGEDPVCGSGNGAVAAFRAANGQLGPAAWRYEARQGRRLSRDGRITLSGDDQGVIGVGGDCITTAVGTLAI